MQSGKASSRTRSRRSGHNSELLVGEKLSRISPRRSFRVVIGELNREFTVKAKADKSRDWYFISHVGVIISWSCG